MSKSSQKITFKGWQGNNLAGRLDMPDGEPKAYALFAHCFTCSKDIFAATRIAGELSDHGFAVLRFDFTGLGASEGEFENTNFSSNVADLLSAANYLRENYQAPKVLIGHSLGGAAVLSVAPEIAEVEAVATIGAPADAEHVIHNFSAEVSEIEKTGIAQVQLAGRSFTIKKQFLEDLRAQSLSERISNSGKALIVFHAPLDQTVGIENAAEIFKAAKHPKSFISLDNADHLLSRRADAAFVASVLSSWAERYLKIDAKTAEEKADINTDNKVIITETGNGKFQQEVRVGKHILKADEPESFGGQDTGPSPYDFLSIALGACTSMTLRMYADHKKIPVEKISVSVTHEKIHAEDCTDCGEGKEGRIDRFERELDVTGTFDADTKKRLLEIADKCPVHKTLEQSSAIVTKLKNE